MPRSELQGQREDHGDRAEAMPTRAGRLIVATPNNALFPPPRPRALWVACGIAQARVITGLSVGILRDHAARGSIPGVSKPAGRWLFVIEDLQRWATRIARPALGPRSKSVSMPRIPRAGRIPHPNPADTASAYERALRSRSSRP